MRGRRQEDLGEFLKLQSARLTELVYRRMPGFGLNLAEDAAQESLLKALQTWPLQGWPENPEAWLASVARNCALNLARREKFVADRVDAIGAATPTWSSSSPGGDEPVEDVRDSVLRLMFLCCHPALSAELQLALVLKTIGGLSVDQIAAAFLAKPDLVNKRLSRARQRLLEKGVDSESVSDEQIPERLHSVMACLYLLFSEGYKSSDKGDLIRPDLCAEALRLARLLVQSSAGNVPESRALLSLMLLNAARFPGRTDRQGQLVTLRLQDRSRWDQGLIAEGLAWLQESASGSHITKWHLEASIAAIHATSPSYAETDWPRILALYDLLVQAESSPFVRLNRAVALAEVAGCEAGLADLEGLGDALGSYHLLHAVKADLLERAGRQEEAKAAWTRAFALAQVEAERTFLQERIEKSRK